VLDISSEENNKNLENEYKKINNNIENIEKNQNSILDILLNSSNFSFYIIKALFSCFCEQWDKNEKLKFIKNLDEEYEKFDLCFGEFNRFKKFLFSQYLKLIEVINEEVVLEKSLKLIFNFMKQIISKYKTNINNINSKIILLHLFESQSIINNFFDFSTKNEIITKKPIKEFIKSSIININNNVLSYHPKPFIFSYIRNNIKNGNLFIVHVIKNIWEFIIECLKRGNLPD
jgi:glycyl-tRNA synthetase beta subunit